jgi:hypothetical protein
LNRQLPALLIETLCLRGFLASYLDEVISRVRGVISRVGWSYKQGKGGLQVEQWGVTSKTRVRYKHVNRINF